MNNEWKKERKKDEQERKKTKWNKKKESRVSRVWTEDEINANNKRRKEGRENIPFVIVCGYDEKVRLSVRHHPANSNSILIIQFFLII